MMLEKFPVVRGLLSEFNKYRRTLVYWLVVLCPFALIFFVYTANSLGAAKSLVQAVENGKNPWEQYILIHYRALSIFLLPLYVAMMTGMVYGREHRNNSWKHLYALPVPRWSIELSKNIFSLLMIFFTIFIYAWFVVLSGYLLSFTHPKLDFTKFDIRLGFNLLMAFKVFFSTLGIWAVHNWLGRRFVNFGYNIGIALIGVISASILIKGWKYVKYYLYAWPAISILDKKELHTLFTQPIILSLTIGLALWGISFWDIQRRKISA